MCGRLAWCWARRGFGFGVDLKALVTGTNRGLGYYLSKALMARGHQVVSVGRAHSECLDNFTVDFLVSENVLETGHEILRTHPDTSLLVLNAGVLGEIGPSSSISQRAFKEVFEVNFFSQKALVDVMIRAFKMETIINISSGSAMKTYEGWSAYGLSKGAMLGLMKYVSLENPRLEILNVNPGPMATEMNWDVRQQASNYSWARKFHDNSLLMKPEEAAQKILSLYERRSAHDKDEVVDLRKL